MAKAHQVQTEHTKSAKMQEREGKKRKKKKQQTTAETKAMPYGSIKTAGSQATYNQDCNLLSDQAIKQPNNCSLQQIPLP